MEEINKKRHKNFILYSYIVTALIFLIVVSSLMLLKITNILNMTHVFVLLVLVIVCFIYDLILIPFRFKRYSFIINSDSLIIIRRGIIKIKTVILAKQIYAMERRSNPMLKKFKLEKLVFVTMGKEFELTGISTDDALEMYNYFLKVKNGKII